MATLKTAVVVLAACAAVITSPRAADAKPKSKRAAARPKLTLGTPQLNGLFVSPFVEAKDTASSTDLLTPAGDKVAVSIESTGEPQAVGQLSDEANSAILGEVPTQHQASYKRLCETPCTLHVPAGRFFVSTVDSTAPGTMLEVAERNVRVRVKTPSRALAVASGLLLGFGGVSAVGGAIVLPLGLSMPQDNVSNDLRIAGGVSLGIGLAMVIPGIVLAILNRSAIEASESP